MRQYQLQGLTLDANSTSPDQQKLVLALQTDLRALGYVDSGLDGHFGQGTARGLAALSYDLLHNVGASSEQDGRAPVSVAAYNKGRIPTIQQTLDQSLAACIDDLMSDPSAPKLPRAANPHSENAKALTAVARMVGPAAPPPYLLAMFVQESGSKHYAVPNRDDADDFVSVGLDRNDGENPEHITSRGYGLGQATLFHHPPTANEVASLIVDPIGNVHAAFAKLRLKFDKFLAGPIDRAADRDAEHPGLSLRLCRYSPSDPKYFRDCGTCARGAKTTVVAQGVPLYSGSSASYQPDQYYPSADYGAVPDRAIFLCDWPYAARRYNGSGLNSFHYQTRILINLTRQPSEPSGG